MSVFATDWALKQRAGGPVPKLVLVLLSDCESGDFQAVFSLERVAEKAEIRIPELRATLDALERKGLITKVDPQVHPATGKPLSYPFMSYYLGDGE